MFNAAEYLVWEALNRDPAIVGLAAGRIYPARIPQNEVVPLLVINRQSGRPEYSLSGYALMSVEILIEAWAKNEYEVKRLAQAVKRTMAEQNGFVSQLIYDTFWYDDDTGYFSASLRFTVYEKGV